MSSKKVTIVSGGKELIVSRKAFDSVYAPAGAVLSKDAGDWVCERTALTPPNKLAKTGAGTSAAETAAKMQKPGTNKRTAKKSGGKAKTKTPTKTKAPDGGGKDGEPNPDAKADAEKLANCPHAKLLMQAGNDVKTFAELTELSWKDILGFDDIDDVRAKEISDFVQANK